MLWMETLIIVGLVLAMCVVVALMVGPLGDTVGSPQDEVPIDLAAAAWSLDRNTRTNDSLFYTPALRHKVLPTAGQVPAQRPHSAPNRASLSKNAWYFWRME
jgi:hypothetical protein